MRSAHYIRLEEERCRRRLTVGIIIITHEPTHTETRSACRRNSTYYIYCMANAILLLLFSLFLSLSVFPFSIRAIFLFFFFFFTVITYCSVPAHTFVIIASPPSFAPRRTCGFRRPEFDGYARRYRRTIERNENRVF